MDLPTGASKAPEGAVRRSRSQGLTVSTGRSNLRDSNQLVIHLFALARAWTTYRTGTRRPIFLCPKFARHRLRAGVWLSSLIDETRSRFVRLLLDLTYVLDPPRSLVHRGRKHRLHQQIKRRNDNDPNFHENVCPVQGTSALSTGWARGQRNRPVPSLLPLQGNSEVLRYR